MISTTKLITLAQRRAPAAPKRIHAELWALQASIDLANENQVSARESALRSLRYSVGSNTQEEQCTI